MPGAVGYAVGYAGGENSRCGVEQDMNWLIIIIGGVALGICAYAPVAWLLRRFRHQHQHKLNPNHFYNQVTVAGEDGRMVLCGRIKMVCSVPGCTHAELLDATVLVAPDASGDILYTKNNKIIGMSRFARADARES